MASEPIEPLDPSVPLNPYVPPCRNVGFQLQGTMSRLLWGALGTLLLSFIGILVTMAFFHGAGRPINACFLTMFCAAGIAIAAFILRFIRFPLGIFMDLDERGLVVTKQLFGPLILAPEKCIEGWYRPQARRVVLVRRGGDLLSADVDDEETATKLLQQLGVDASKRTMRIRLGAVDFLNVVVWLVGPWASFTLSTKISVAVHMVTTLLLPLAIAFFILGFFLVHRLLGPAHLVIGADGVIVEQRFGRRFVPYKDLASISTASDHVTLHLLDGTKVRAKALRLGAEVADVIERRIRDALALRDQRAAEPAALATLDRGERNGAAWREALRGLSDKDRGYRQAKLTLEQISAVLEDPAARVDRRIGAAMVLAQSKDPEFKSKIRVAVESSANRKVRVAFEAIARGDLENAAIEEAAVEEMAQASRVGKVKR